jgi:4,5-dihydroxyphthalate decarboxylase
MLPDLLPAIERSRAVFGPDVWTYGLEENRQVIDTFLRYAKEQALVRDVPDVDALFLPVRTSNQPKY